MHFRHFRALAAASLLAVAACTDGPTAPTSYAQVAGGVRWVAVAEPAGLPRPDTWLPYVAAGSPARVVVHGLRARAARARVAGRVEEAMALEGEALRVAAGAVSRPPEAPRVLAAAAALDAWVQRAHARLETDHDAALSAAVREVSARADAARHVLAAGNAAAAAVEVSEGTLRVREHAPMAVGLRLLARAEARLAGGAGQGQARDRARALVTGAREGLAVGDSVRALRRAVYALQLLDSGTVDSAAVPR